MQYSLDKKIRKKKTYKKRRKIKHKIKHKKTHNLYKSKHKTRTFRKYKKKRFKNSFKKNKKGGFILKSGDSLFPLLTGLQQNASTSFGNAVHNMQGKSEIPTPNPVDQPLFEVDTTKLSTPASVNEIYNNAVSSV